MELELTVFISYTPYVIYMYESNSFPIITVLPLQWNNSYHFNEPIILIDEIEIFF